jgi:hypothetical protein
VLQKVSLVLSPLCHDVTRNIKINITSHIKINEFNYYIRKVIRFMS